MIHLTSCSLEHDHLCMSNVCEILIFFLIMKEKIGSKYLNFLELIYRHICRKIVFLTLITSQRHKKLPKCPQR